MDFMLTREEEEQCVTATKAGCKHSFTRLIKAHERLVHSCARYYCRFYPSKEELVSEGMLALVVAIQHFEPSKGARLNTYARWWIQAYLRRFTLDNRRSVQPPRTRGARIVTAAIRRLEAKHAALTGCRPSAEEIAAELDVRPREVEEMQSFLSSRDASSDAYELRFTGAAQTPEQILMARERIDMLRAATAKAMKAFPEREKIILQARVLEEDSQSLKDLGVDYGVTRQRIQQVLAEARNELYDSIAMYMAEAQRSPRSRDQGEVST